MQSALIAERSARFADIATEEDELMMGTYELLTRDASLESLLDTRGDGTRLCR